MLASSGVEQLSTLLNRFRGTAHRHPGRLQRLKICRQSLYFFLRNSTRVQRSPKRFVDLVLEFGHAAVPGPGPTSAHTQQ